MEEFPAEDTRPREFRAPSGKRVVPTMHRVGAFGHTARQGRQALLIPCDEAMDVVALMPDAPLATAELDGETFADLLTGARFTEVDLYLPKVDLTAASELAAPLRALGAGPLFDSWLMVGKVLHQATLRVNEQGVEGAAATAVIAFMGSHDPREALVVRFDRPFLLAVRHRRTGLLLFLAEVSEPQDARRRGGPWRRPRRLVRGSVRGISTSAARGRPRGPRRARRRPRARRP
ncbi:serpin family protein [Saccharothrix isguenensis]